MDGMKATETLIFTDALFKAFDYKPMPEPVRECEIDGNRVPFNYCSGDDLADSIEFYDNATYIGSSHRTWYDGVLNEWDKLHHFFVKK